MTNAVNSVLCCGSTGEVGDKGHLSLLTHSSIWPGQYTCWLPAGIGSTGFAGYKHRVGTLKQYNTNRSEVVCGYLHNYGSTAGNLKQATSVCSADNATVNQQLELMECSNQSN